MFLGQSARKKGIFRARLFRRMIKYSTHRPYRSAGLSGLKEPHSPDFVDLVG